MMRTEQNRTETQIGTNQLRVILIYICQKIEIYYYRVK